MLRLFSNDNCEHENLGEVNLLHTKMNLFQSKEKERKEERENRGFESLGANFMHYSAPYS